MGRNVEMQDTPPTVADDKRSRGGRPKYVPTITFGVLYCFFMNRILQRSRDVLLFDNFRECLRTPLSRNDLIAHDPLTDVAAGPPQATSRLAHHLIRLYQPLPVGG